MQKFPYNLGKQLANELQSPSGSVFSTFSKRHFELQTSDALRQKDYYDAHIALYWFCVVLTFACQAASAVSEYAYFSVAFSSKLGGVWLIIGTGFSVVVLEAAKFFVVNAMLSQIFVLGKARLPFALLLVSLALSAVSAYASVVGGATYGTDNQKVIQTTQQFDNEIGQLRGDIVAIQQRNSWQGNVWLPKNEKALLHAKEVELTKLKAQKETSLQVVAQENSRRETVFQWWFGTFEGVFLLCTAFVWYFRKRVAIEFLAISPTETVKNIVVQEAAQPQPQMNHYENPKPQRNEKKIGFVVQTMSNNLPECECSECGGSFLKRTTWQRFCSEYCRISAWEQKTGKKFQKIKK